MHRLAQLDVKPRPWQLPHGEAAVIEGRLYKLHWLDNLLNFVISELGDEPIYPLIVGETSCIWYLHIIATEFKRKYRGG